MEFLQLGAKFLQRLIPEPRVGHLRLHFGDFRFQFLEPLFQRLDPGPGLRGGGPRLLALLVAGGAGGGLLSQGPGRRTPGSPASRSFSAIFSI